MNISAIAAVGQNWELGKDNDLIWKSEADLAHFREFTMGKALLVGPKTYQSMPPMTGRKVICVARSFLGRVTVPKQEGDVFVGEIERGLSFIETVKAQAGGRDIVLIGGAKTYEVFAQDVTELVLTRFPDSDPDADTYFPKDSYKELLGCLANTQKLTSNIVTETYKL